MITEDAETVWRAFRKKYFNILDFELAFPA